mmetsp:Transcript_36224/g.90384  ORF Transcript_36224/g.90384 Transcript_36224/m.90384 type:complete len:147 (+) Transcript_36224:188-628(+)
MSVNQGQGHSWMDGGRDGCVRQCLGTRGTTHARKHTRTSEDHHHHHHRQQQQQQTTAGRRNARVRVTATRGIASPPSQAHARTLMHGRRMNVYVATLRYATSQSVGIKECNAPSLPCYLRRCDAHPRSGHRSGERGREGGRDWPGH